MKYIVMHCTVAMVAQRGIDQSKYFNVNEVVKVNEKLEYSIIT